MNKSEPRYIVQVPAGWQLVPCEPTPQMIAAGASRAFTAGAYEAMLSVAPKPDPAPAIYEEWYTDTNNGSHHIDFDDDASNQLSIILSPDGRVLFAAYKEGKRTCGSINDPRFNDVLCAFIAKRKSDGAVFGVPALPEKWRKEWRDASAPELPEMNALKYADELERELVSDMGSYIEEIKERQHQNWMNGCPQPCDVPNGEGPCCCGAWHDRPADLSEQHWVFTAAEGLRFYVDRMTENDNVTGPRHLLWMIEKISEGMSSTKACRWLGWIQCAVVASGVASMQEMKAYNERHREN